MSAIRFLWQARMEIAWSTKSFQPQLAVVLGCGYNDYVQLLATETSFNFWMSVKATTRGGAPFSVAVGSISVVILEQNGREIPQTDELKKWPIKYEICKLEEENLKLRGFDIWSHQVLLRQHRSFVWRFLTCVRWIVSHKDAKRLLNVRVINQAQMFAFIKKVWKNLAILSHWLFKGIDNPLL